MRAPRVKFLAIDGKQADVRRSRPLMSARSAEADVCLRRLVPNAIVSFSAGASWWRRGHPRSSSYPCRRRRANTTSSMRAKRRHDAVSFGAVAAVLLLVAVLASIVPARRAARVDPVQVLRA